MIRYQTGDIEMQTAADRLWNATHRDFRAVIEGKRYVMRTVKGAFGFVPVEEAARA